jgi:hypothetical protein
VVRKKGDDVDTIMKNLGSGNIILVDDIYDDISSADIRSSLKEKRKGYAFLVLDWKVENYIDSHDYIRDKESGGMSL